jgi:hypothetical protein
VVCVACGVWCVLCGVWCAVWCVQCVMCGVWCVWCEFLFESATCDKFSNMESLRAFYTNNVGTEAIQRLREARTFTESDAYKANVAFHKHSLIDRVTLVKGLSWYPFLLYFSFVYKLAGPITCTINYVINLIMNLLGLALCLLQSIVKT